MKLVCCSRARASAPAGDIKPDFLIHIGARAAAGGGGGRRRGLAAVSDDETNELDDESEVQLWRARSLSGPPPCRCCLFEAFVR